MNTEIESELNNDYRQKNIKKPTYSDIYVRAICRLRIRTPHMHTDWIEKSCICHTGVESRRKKREMSGEKLALECIYGTWGKKVH